MIRTPDQMRARIREYCTESARVKELLPQACGAAVVQATQLMTESFRNGGKLLLCGNGGSAADCQHMAAEFVSRLSKDFERPAIAAIALTTDTSFLTAYANDISYEGVFERQVEALGRASDVLLGISTSGSSKNVVRAFEYAHRIGMSTIALCGAKGKLIEMATVAISVPSDNTQFIQESHLAIEHLLCELTEFELYGEGRAP